MKVCIAQYAGIDAVSGLPLAAGLLVSTARLHPELAGCRYDLQVERLPLDSAVRALGEPDVLGLSMYPWNAAYSQRIAAEARAQLPHALIVAGGPAVPRRAPAARAFLDEHPAIDVLVLGEGELVFRDLLLATRRGEPLDSVRALVIRDPTGHRFTAPVERVKDFSATGSPYLDGTFDALLRHHPGRFSLALCETNRGCPFSCTFCDWSATPQVVEYPLQRLRAEIDWVARSGLPNLCFTDANFGIRRRDRGIAELVASAKKRTGTPSFCYFYLTKNNHKKNLDTIDVFTEAGVDFCVGLAVQDFDDGVLEAVKRSNIQTDHTLALREICAERGIRTHNELILGLPAQTYDSFATTVLRAMPGHPRHDFRIFLCRLIDNTELGSVATREQYGINSRRCLWRSSDGSFDPIVDEYQEVVVGTKHMSVHDWRRTCRFAFFAAAAYNQRILRTVLRYFGEVGVDRRAYLEHLCAAMDGHTTPRYRAVGAAIDRVADSILNNGPLSLPIDGLGPNPYEMAEAVTVAALRDVDGFFAETWALTRAFLIESEREVVEDLLSFQALGTPRFGQSEPQEVTLKHDWLAYSASRVGAAPVKKPTTVRYTPPAYVRIRDEGAFMAVHLAVGSAGGSMGELTYSAAGRRMPSDAPPRAVP